MKIKQFIISSLISLISLFMITAVQAGTPLWTFTPLTATTLTVPANGTATVQYQIINQSSASHTLTMKPIQGITQLTTGNGICGSIFTLASKGASCVLSLQVNGDQMAGNIYGGPVVCQQGSSNQCYQPAQADVLNISKTEAIYTVGGNVYGLSGSLVLENNDHEPLTLTADGSFAFATPQQSGETYSVTVRTQPANQLCTVSNGTGTISHSSVTNIVVNCSTNAFTVGGNTTGLASGESVVLENNGGDNLTIATEGPFTFSTLVAQGATYNVTILSQPSTQTCTVTNGSGTMGGSGVTNVSVTCATNAYTVGGAVTNLTSGQSLVLQNNGTDNQTINANGSFSFAAPVAQGAPYNVTVLTQPRIQTCTVSNGSGTMGSSDVTNVSVACVTNTTTLSTSISNLALSQTGYTEYGIPGTPASGTARTLTVSNTGSYTATNFSLTYPTWPSGTIAISDCGSSLAPASSCTITITPGNTATSDGTNPCTTTGTAPIPQDISINADNASTVSSSVLILGYGCIYQGGYVYALDDTTATSTSVGGNVAATSDQATPFSPGIIWSSNGSGGASFIAIYGISETSTILSPNPSSGQVSGQTACNGNTDGLCDSNNIFIYYENNATGHPINTSSYAAGLCKQTISTYADWYLPAICELGYSNGPSNGCGTSGTPTLQNMQSNLVDNLNLLSSSYWSATEYSSLPNIQAWIETFATGGASNQSAAVKGGALGVRCSRALTV